MSQPASSVKGQTFEPESVQKALVNTIIFGEFPFSVVEQDEVKEIMETEFSGFQIPSSETISRDCTQLFMDEKLKLKSFIKTTKQRVCLSLDTWKSNQSVKYLCITAHFIDENWKLHKKIIGFSPIGSDNGEEIGKAVENCLHDWEIGNVLAISAGNASSYDAAISYLGSRLVNLVLDGKHLRLKCLVELTNTMVKGVLKDYDKLISHVRAMVRCVKQSPDRIKKFKQRARECGIVFKSLFTLDCPSRWTSTCGIWLKSLKLFSTGLRKKIQAILMNCPTLLGFRFMLIGKSKYKHDYTDEGVPLLKKKSEWVVAAAYDLFNEYVGKSEAQHQTAKFETSGYMSYLYHDTGPKGLFQKRVVGFGGNEGCKSEINIYLNEDEDFEDYDGFDVLLWWKVNSERFPVLFKMAKDVLAIPISAVALESDINIDGNLLDDFRSSLSPPMSEALVCTQDWLNKSKKQMKGKKGSTKLADKILKGIKEQLEGTTSGCG